MPIEWFVINFSTDCVKKLGNYISIICRCRVKLMSSRTTVCSAYIECCEFALINTIQLMD